MRCQNLTAEARGKHPRRGIKSGSEISKLKFSNPLNILRFTKSPSALVTVWRGQQSKDERPEIGPAKC